MNFEFIVILKGGWGIHSSQTFMWQKYLTPNPCVKKLKRNSRIDLVSKTQS